MAALLPGIRLPKRKYTENMSPVIFPPPDEVIIPMQMHIGSSAIPTVNVGDKVAVGSLIGRAQGKVSSNIHSSIAGSVSEIPSIVLPGGKESLAVRIRSDGTMRKANTINPPKVRNREDFLTALFDSGIVGLGGAGFPTHVKYSVDPSRIEEVVLNGAECEPYITSDTLTMVEETENIITALEAIREFLGVKRFIIGIERGNSAAVKASLEMSVRFPLLEVKLLRDLYPQGGEKVLIYHTTGKIVPIGKLPVDVGCIVSNISTVAAIGKYITDGMPLVSRCITVDGDGSIGRGNVIVPIGCPISDVFEYFGGVTEDAELILYGGPMMGVSTSESLPIMKNTNALLALSTKSRSVSHTTACIRCGSCRRHCPFGIDPAAVARAVKRGDTETVVRLRIDGCMECGCCTYVCPARLPLSETNRNAKAMLKRKKEETESRRNNQ